MKPFNSIEEARAELAEMPTKDLQALSDVTNEAFEIGMIGQEQYDFVTGLIVDEAMTRITAVIEKILAGDTELAPEGETFH